MHDSNRIIHLLQKGVSDGVYPGAVLLIARQGKTLLFQAIGHRSLAPEPMPMRKETIFDLASLTKPLVTSLALMKLVDDEKVNLDQPLSDIFPKSLLNDKKNLTLRLILSHSAGFTDWKPFYLDLVKYDPKERKKIIRDWIIQEPLAYEPGIECRYSDLGFMLLEWIIEKICERSLKQFLEEQFYKPLGLKNIFLGIQDFSHGTTQKEFAATEDCPWRKRVIQGEVHDENAFAMGGYSGHAGLFGDARSVYSILNMLRAHYIGKKHDFIKQKIVREFFRKQEIVKDCTWALGWDTPSPENSSAGHHFSSNSIGHLGFTGTSVWMDLEQEIMVILLTNRIHPTRNNDKLKAFRPILHDTVMEEYGTIS